MGRPGPHPSLLPSDPHPGGSRFSKPGRLRCECTNAHPPPRTVHKCSLSCGSGWGRLQGSQAPSRPRPPTPEHTLTSEVPAGQTYAHAREATKPDWKPDASPESDCPRETSSDAWRRCWLSQLGEEWHPKAGDQGGPWQDLYTLRGATPRSQEPGPLARNPAAPLGRQCSL